MEAIRVEEWMEELARLSQRSDEGQTFLELCEAVGKSERTVRGMLKKAHQLGYVRVGKRSSTTIDGKPSTVPVYSIVIPRKKSAARP